MVGVVLHVLAGEGHPARPTTGLVVADLDRVALVVCGAVTALQIVTLNYLALRGRRHLLRAQWARMVSHLAADVYVTFTEIGRIHHVVTWRLFVGNAVLLFAMYGLAQQLGQLRDQHYPREAGA